MLTEYVRCDLCGNQNFTHVWDKTVRRKHNMLTSRVIEDEEGNIVNGTNVICNVCGLVQLNPRMTEEETEKYYSKKYRETYDIDEHGERYHASMVLDYLVRAIDYKEIKYVLDVGCSTGKLIDNFENLGKMSYGVEQNNVAAEKAKLKGYNVTNCRIEDYKPPLEVDGFDLVTIVNTLEHMHSPTTTLNKIHELLKPDGLIFICVPFLYNNNIALPTDAFMSNAHLYTFDNYVMFKYLDKCGFDLVNFSIVNENNMQKIYVLAKKSDKKELKFDKEIRPQEIINRLTFTDYLALTQFKAVRG